MRGTKWGCIAICALMMFSTFTTLFSSERVDGQTSNEDLILRVCLNEDISTFNPLAAVDATSKTIIDLIYDTPMSEDPYYSQLVPYLANGTTTTTSSSYFNFDDTSTLNATELAISSLGKVCTVWYNLTNAKWHDDHPMDVEDLLFSFYVAALNPKTINYANCIKGSNFTETHYLFINCVYLSLDEKIVALRFYLQQNYYNFFNKTLAPLLLPTHIWATTQTGQRSNECRPWFPRNDSKEWKLSNASKWDCKINNIYRIIGSGPFKFESYEMGQSLKLSTWRDHFYTKQPRIEGVQFRFFLSPESALLPLVNDDTDYIAWSIPPSYINDLQRDENIGLSQSEQRGFVYLAYNMRRPSFGYNSAGVDKGLHLRRAIAHCIDKNYIVGRLLQNYGHVANCPINSLDTGWYNNSSIKYAFDENSTKEVLQQAGYIEPDWGNPATLGTASNCWKNPDGSNIGSEPDGKIKILTPQGDYDPVRYQAGIMIQNNLKKAGIYAESVPMDMSSIDNQVNANNFDIYISHWTIGSEPPDFMWAFFHSNSSLNYPGYRNVSFDRIVDDAWTADNETQRKDFIKEVVGIISIDLPYDVLYFRQSIEAYRADRFVGWMVGPDGSIFSKYSLINIMRTPILRLYAEIMTDSAVVSNGTCEVIVYVKDQDKRPVAGAKVLMSTSAGTISPSEKLTDRYGKARFTFTAPYVGNNVTDRECSINFITAEKEGFDYAHGRIATINVVGQGIDFLIMHTEVDSSVLKSNDTTSIHVTVRNGRLANRPPVEGVSLIARSSGSSNITPRKVTTDAYGKATFTFRAPVTQYNGTYKVLFDAVLDQYVPTSQGAYIDVLILENPPPQIVNSSLETVALFGAIPLIAVAIVILSVRRMRKRRLP